MAVYKVLQDIEAEDKLLGPLTLKQFIFAIISVGFLFAAFMVATKVNMYLAIIFLPFIIVPGILAAPIGKDQPTDVWLAAVVRFYIKPRKRIWDQSGLKELVTITVPKKIEKVYTDGLNQHEVKSRLKALADTIDSRGWVIKNVDVNNFTPPQLAYDSENYNRLIDPASLPKAVDDYNVQPYEDILADDSPTSQHFAQMVDNSTKNNRAAAVAKMQDALKNTANQPTSMDDLLSDIPVPTKEDLWYLDQQPPEQANSASQNVINEQLNKENNTPNSADQIEYNTDPNQVMFTDQTVAPLQNDNKSTNESAKQASSNTDTDINEAELLKKIKAEKATTANPHHKTIKTPEQIAKEQQEQQKQEELNKAQAVTPPKNPDIVRLATESGDDLSIDSIAKIASKKAAKAKNDGEVVINLR